MRVNKSPSQAKSHYVSNDNNHKPDAQVNKTGANYIHRDINTKEKSPGRNSIKNIRTINTQSKAIKVIKPGTKSMANTASKKHIPSLKKVKDLNVSAVNLHNGLKATKQIKIKNVGVRAGYRTMNSSKLSTSISAAKRGRSPNKVIAEVFPMTTVQVLKKFGKDLSDFEKAELLDYETIYYMGNGIARYNAEIEGGYDDERGDYNTYVGEQVGYRYEIIDILGKGSFGQALKCIDHKNKELVALKIIRSKKKFYNQAIVEVKVLDYIRICDKQDKSNIVRMLDYFMFRKHIVRIIISIVHFI